MTIRASHIVVDDFLPAELAQHMRAGIDAHFANPASHGPERQVWNYWFIPGQYIYLRTSAEKVIEKPCVDAFVSGLRGWAIRFLGLSEVTWPYLSLYINGCRQGVHNDSLNGHFAFVYSLTRNERRSTGGETLIYHEGDLFRRGLERASAGSDFHATIAPAFNRLVVFDDRMPHAVSPVEGPMDPLEGRFVLHGHLRAESMIAEGSLKPEEVTTVVFQALKGFTDTTRNMGAYRGLLTLRIVISADGRVEACDTLLDRVICTSDREASWAELAADIVARVRMLRFPAAADRTIVTQPILLSGG